MLFSAILSIGLGLGLAIAALGHPSIGGALLGTRRRTDDHRENEGF